MRIRPSLCAPLVLLAGCFNPEGPAPADTDAASSSAGPATTTGSRDPTTEAVTSTSDPTTGPTSGTAPTTGTEGSTTSSSGDPDTGSSSGGVVQLECALELLDGTLGSPVATADSNFGRSTREGSCGGVSSNELIYQWVAPYDGYFIIDTAGSDYDTVLYLLDTTCDGEEVACSDDTEKGATSQLVVQADQGQQLLVVIDGSAGGTGNAVLNINPVACPGADLSDVPLPDTFTNAAAQNEYSSACGGDDGAERTFRYTPTEAGLYSFKATSTEMDPIVDLELGPVCGGPNRGCNYTSHPGGSEVIRYLDAGESATMYVDAATAEAGEFEVDITTLPHTCPSGALAEETVFTIDDFPHAMTTSCTPASRYDSGTATDHPAATFSWTSPGQIGGNSGCDLEVTAGFPFGVSLQSDADCGGEELQCNVAEFDGDSYTGSVGVGHIPPTDFTITVTSSFGGGGVVPIFNDDFTIQVFCFAVG